MSALVATLQSAIPRPRILIVDDDPAIASIFQRALESDGEVAVVLTGAGALIWLAEHDGADVVLIDVNLGDWDGCKLARRILRWWPETRLQFVSGDPRWEVAKYHPCPEDLPLLVKPFPLPSLRAAIAARLASPVWYPSRWREADGPII